MAHCSIQHQIKSISIRIRQIVCSKTFLCQIKNKKRQKKKTAAKIKEEKNNHGHTQTQTKTDGNSK